ncbi:MAG: protein-L-isoaspartate(D-aspartate) O-methyltransferase [Thermoguttaceae bacterium]|nr:protein-L-isoaspartate(D-aspartate) O-methyltransferase [Thermoguttaceae bacterium]MDW8080180.1 protein-L-isoaspartate(D-aspartate) O-methyltransferase [Thermoguttaceae bacterium]
MDPKRPEALREKLVNRLAARGIASPRVLWAMRQVPRELFVPAACAYEAYEDKPLAIGFGQTISQPSMVALMTELAEPQPADRVLEIGTGSGYQAALLALLSKEVVTIERFPALAIRAAKRLSDLGIWNVLYLVGDGTLGWPHAAPYQRIIVTAAAPKIPKPLLEQLADGGILVIPVGCRTEQVLIRAEKKNDGLRYEHVIHCRFVPLVGQFGWPEE